MPQREFWATRHPSAIKLDVLWEPTAPDRPLSFALVVLDQARETMAMGYTTVPPSIADEAVASLFSEGWLAYANVGPDAVPKAVSEASSRWRSYAAQRGY